jgi:glycosyltransferase involved in cell wall biosynthesis
VLHLLSQRPSRTGSGITLDALVCHAAAAGWDQHALVGVPVDDPGFGVGGLPAAAVSTVTFGAGGDLGFPVPGMSDVMPYPSTVFSTMEPAALDRYREVWRARVAGVVRTFRPDVIHAHHVWILSSLVRDVAPDVPLVVHCHATGLRQRALCGHVADAVAAGVARADRFVVLHGGHAEVLSRDVGIDPQRIVVVGAGYRDDLFHDHGRRPAARPRIVYVGKYSASKGVPSLIDAFERVMCRVPEVELHVAGSGAGDEADALARRMRALAPSVVPHGALSQSDLADLLRTSRVCVLPSFYEGVPLVLVEARACGCRLVATDLPGVREALAPALGADLTRVAPPAMVGVDVPDPAELPAFVDRLTAELIEALAAPPVRTGPLAAARLEPFTWAAVFRRVERVWCDLLPGTRR